MMILYTALNTFFVLNCESVYFLPSIPQKSLIKKEKL